MKNDVSRQLGPFRILVGFAAFVILAIGFLAVGISTAIDMRTAFDAMSWPTTQAKVVESTLQPHCDKNWSFRPTIRYSYSAQAATYTSDRIDFGSGHCGSQEAAEAILRQFPVGSILTVHFNPQAPEQAAIDINKVPSGGAGWATVAVAIAVVIFSLTGAVVTFPKAKAALA